MPFANNEDLPEKIRNNLPEKAQAIWRNVFNSADKSGADEESANKQAWGAVKNAGYKKDDSGKWILKKFKSDNEENLFKANCRVTDVDNKLGLVFGWGMVTEIDGQPYFDTDNQHITSDAMVKATSGFMEGQRISNDSHTSSDIGTVIHSFPLSKDIAESMGVQSRLSGWMVAVKVSDEILKKFESGEYTGFSVEGAANYHDIED